MESKIAATCATITIKPSLAEFANFREFIKSLEPKNYSLIKVIPPAEWSSKSQQISDDYVLSSITIQKPSKLKHGGFDIGFDKLETMTYANYVKECKEMEAKLCGGQKLTVEQIEDLHWSKLCKVKKKYAINNDKSLFGEDVSIWNLDKFTSKESTIHSNQTHHRCDDNMPGILSPYSYVGSIISSFGFHIEDGNLNSINYMHAGDIKLWYYVPKEDAAKLEALAAIMCKDILCDLYIRHKTLLIPPSVLIANGIKFGRILQNPGEFILSFSGTFHSGFNCGVNINEAINFGSDGWLNFIDTYTECTCEFRPMDPILALEQLYGIIDRVIKAPKISCTKCKSTFKQRKNFLKHNRINHGKFLFVYKCPVCGTTCTTASNMKVHLRDIHGTDMDLSSVKKLGKLTRKSKTEEEVKAANRANPKKKRPAKTCELCGTICHGESNMNRHKANIHGIVHSSGPSSRSSTGPSTSK